VSGASPAQNSLRSRKALLPPADYRTAIAELARKHSFGMKWLDEHASRRAGANAFLAVAAGGLAHVNMDITGFGVRYALELIIGQKILAEVETG